MSIRFPSINRDIERRLFRLERLARADRLGEDAPHLTDVVT